MQNRYLFHMSTDVFLFSIHFMCQARRPLSRSVLFPFRNKMTSTASITNETAVINMLRSNHFAKSPSGDSLKNTMSCKTNAGTHGACISPKSLVKPCTETSINPTTALIRVDTRITIATFSSKKSRGPNPFTASIKKLHICQIIGNLNSPIKNIFMTISPLMKPSFQAVNSTWPFPQKTDE